MTTQLKELLTYILIAIIITTLLTPLFFLLGDKEHPLAPQAIYLILAAIFTVIAFTELGALYLMRLKKKLRDTNTRVSQFEQPLEDSKRELQSLQTLQEQRVLERTFDLERRVQHWQASAEIANAIAPLRDLEALLKEIPTLINERFGYHPISIFLADRSGQALVMRASNSQAGKQLIERGFTLKTGQTSIVGSVADSLSPYLSMDVRGDARYAGKEHLAGIENLSEISLASIPELQETRSEIALPLIARGKLLGVLDIQSKNEAAFTPEDGSILQVLAEQISNSIENSQAFTEKQQTIEAIQRAYSAMSREAWQKLLRSQPELGYYCASVGDPVVATGEWSPEMIQASKIGEMVQIDDFTLALPIKIRGQVTGVVRLRKPEDIRSPWNKNEIELVETLNDRLSTTLESAQLYEETRRRAERERLTGEIIAKVRSSNDPQVILQTAVRELRRALQADRAQLLVQESSVHKRLGLPSNNEFLETDDLAGKEHLVARDLSEHNPADTDVTDNTEW